MIYKFKSKAAGDLIMMGPSGDQVLRIIGKEPAAQGIIEPAAMSAAMAAIERAIAEDEAARAHAEQEAQAEGRTLAPREGVTLRQRAWPMVEMMKRAQAAVTCWRSPCSSIATSRAPLGPRSAAMMATRSSATTVVGDARGRGPQAAIPAAQ